MSFCCSALTSLIEAGNVAGLVLGPVRVVDRLRATPREVAYRVFTPVTHPNPAGHPAYDGHPAYNGTVNGSVQVNGQVNGVRS